MQKEIEIVDYQFIWVEEFTKLKDYLMSIITTPVRIEHVGSTSVEGLSAKPIIDLVIIIQNNDELKIVINDLEENGYYHNGNQGIEDREAFKYQSSNYYRHHLYACIENALPLRNFLAVRNSLRDNQELRERYGSLKKKLACKFKYDIDSYISGKSNLLLSILKENGFTKEELEIIRSVNE